MKEVLPSCIKCASYNIRLWIENKTGIEHWECNKCKYKWIVN